MERSVPLETGSGPLSRGGGGLKLSTSPWHAHPCPSLFRAASRVPWGFLKPVGPRPAFDIRVVGGGPLVALRLLEGHTWALGGFFFVVKHVLEKNAEFPEKFLARSQCCKNTHPRPPGPGGGNPPPRIGGPTPPHLNSVWWSPPRWGANFFLRPPEGVPPPRPPSPVRDPTKTTSSFFRGVPPAFERGPAGVSPTSASIPMFSGSLELVGIVNENTRLSPGGRERQARDGFEVRTPSAFERKTGTRGKATATVSTSLFRVWF